MILRVVANELHSDLTTVSTVITPNPETVSPEISVIEALQNMHDNKILTLLICENDGRVCGVVDVIELIYGYGGMDEWRSIFDSAMDIRGNYSDTESIQSDGSQSLCSVPSSISILKSVGNRHQFYWKCSMHSRRRYFCNWVYYICCGKCTFIEW